MLWFSRITVVGSSVSSSISEVFRNTLPRHIRHKSSSNDGIRSLLRIPAMKLKFQRRILVLKSFHGSLINIFSFKSRQDFKKL